MRFFKAMVSCFHITLDLPPDVCIRLKNVKSRSVKLRSPLGTWKVGLCRDKDVVFFCQGWSEFVVRHDLNEGEFLVFERTSHSRLHFDVSVFDSNGDEKEFAAPEEERENAVEEEEEESPCFSKIMVSSYATNKITVNILKEFMMENNLGKQTSATLRDPMGRKWTVDLTTGCRKRGEFRSECGEGGIISTSPTPSKMEILVSFDYDVVW